MSEYAIGVDLGGTKIAAALVDRAGHVLAETRRLTQPADGAEAVIDRIAACIREVQAACSREVAGIGVGIPGAVDTRSRVVIEAVNLGWSDLPAGDLLIEQLGSAWSDKLWMDKDANAAAVAELLYGVGQGAQQMIYVTVGTGVGAGLIFNGRLYHGATSGDGNIGHVIVEPDGDPCPCGKSGCVETVASGPSIARRAAAALRRGETSSLSPLDSAQLTAEAVAKAAHEGDPFARRFWTEAGRALGIALAYYVDLTNPELIVIGGGVGRVGDLLLDPLRATIKARALPINTHGLRVVRAALADAGAVGAAALVWMNSQGN